jgi:alpha-galactosidase
VMAQAAALTGSLVTKTNTEKVPVSLLELGFTGAVQVRDLWQKKDLGVFTGEFAPDIAPHGGQLYRVSPR